MSLRVESLYYGIGWRSTRKRWAPEVFPATVDLPGWQLEVTEHRITARPRSRIFGDQGEASDDLEPPLASWAAELAVVHDLPVQYWFMDAVMVPETATIVMTSRSELTVNDFISADDDVQVVWTRAELPAPTWAQPQSMTCATSASTACCRYAITSEVKRMGLLAR